MLRYSSSLLKSGEAADYHTASLGADLSDCGFFIISTECLGSQKPRHQHPQSKASHTRVVPRRWEFDSPR